MADQRDFELLDDYLTHHMSEENRTAFEQKIQADPDLQHEYTLQKRFVQGIKDARVADLKSMLNKVAVPPNNPGGTVVSKVILGTVVSLLIAAAGYWYFKPDDVKQPQADTVTREQAPTIILEEPATPEVEPLQKPKQKAPAIKQQPQVEANKNQTSAGTEHSKPSLAKRPDPIHAPAPGEKSGEKNNGDDNGDDVNAESPLIIETDAENTQFTFHYQFQEGNLVLYGPFEQNQYEVVEFAAGEKTTLFLYHNDIYYGLEQSGDNIRPLQAVTDPVVLKKLTESRPSK